jgi:hypothetical protein
VIFTRASKELYFIPSPPMGERVRVSGKAIAFPPPSITMFFVRLKGKKA